MMIQEIDGQKWALLDHVEQRIKRLEWRADYLERSRSRSRTASFALTITIGILSGLLIGLIM